MKILLVGEYSGLHNSLKEGLIQLNHKVTLVSSGDNFKKYPSDFYTNPKFIEQNFLLNIVFKLLRKLHFIDLKKIETGIRAYIILKKLKGFDIVQLINIDACGSYPFIEKKIVSLLKKQNNKLFLLSAGTDYYSVKYAVNKKIRYSILTPLFEQKVTEKYFKPTLKFITKPYRKLNDYVYKNINGVIASDLDYHIPLKNHPKYLGLVPNCIVFDKFNFELPEIHHKIIIYHGINNYNYYKKGNDIFEEALTILSKKHPNKIEIITTRSIPYAAYINTYNKAHILLDQVYAYDQGYNALEAMAKGKVVFTGAEKEWLTYYNLKEDTVAINALPCAKEIAKKLEWLILNPHQIKVISKNARAFIEREHNYIKSAQKYIEKWRA
ncbi:MAG: glycosyltransferase [Flavobacteriaceae bacterium]|nr:glycosyltransferase [Flavobacteriaceae bacterium]